MKLFHFTVPGIILAFAMVANAFASPTTVLSIEGDAAKTFYEGFQVTGASDSAYHITKSATGALTCTTFVYGSFLCECTFRASSSEPELLGVRDTFEDEGPHPAREAFRAYKVKIKHGSRYEE